MISVEVDLHLRAAELLVRERRETGRMTLDDVRGLAAAKCLDERVLIALVFGYDRSFYPKQVSQDDGLLVMACNLAAEAAGLTTTIEVV